MVSLAADALFGAAPISASGSFGSVGAAILDCPRPVGSSAELLMAHARAQPAQALVDLDRWVRDGGRVLLLADPRLDWESGRPLGDKLRPPPAFADTGLLAHWGLTLSGPTTDGRGFLASTRPSRSCEVLSEGFIARCRIGAGSATIIADADFLNGEPQSLDLLMDELGQLESR